MSSHRADTRNTEAIAEIKEEVRLAQWQKQIEERQGAGLSIAAWCDQQGISKTTYYYRLRRVRAHLCRMTGMVPGELPEQYLSRSKEEHRIVPIRETVQIPAERESRIEITCGELRVSFHGDTSPEALKAVIEALRSC